MIGVMGCFSSVAISCFQEVKLNDTSQPIMSVR